ncbi:NAD(P)-binding protein [Rhizodiscina lignyota]|uniref:NAD(P)-binding protein n=1 Tax=Rhizodiscina lignyota TaxID=1504668 RepID=A0A9P4IBQ3_9PEZI|nr:NAD(P)-binding protein [Rhizodiscina lignyota]
MAPSVLLIGASGAFGRPLVEEFINQLSKFDKVGILANPSKVSKFANVASRGIHVVPGSFVDPKSYAGYDAVVSLAGNAIMRLQPAMIDAAIAGGVTHFYPSEYGSDVAQEALKEFRYFRDKRVVRNHLVAAARAHPDFRYTLMLTGPFTEWTIDKVYSVYQDDKKVVTYGRPDAPIDVTSIPDISRYTVLSILLPFVSGQQKREIRVVGESTTFQGLIDVLGEVEGKAYQTTYLPADEALAEQEKARKAEDEEAELAWSLRTLGAGGFAIVPGPLDNARFDFPPESVRETFERVFPREQ